MTVLSTVTPVYRGEAYLTDLVAELERVRAQLEDASIPLRLAESVFVVDDASDRSESVLRELASSRPWMKVVTLSRNFGQHPATVAGILQTTGDWVATLDEDLQHHPKHLLPLLATAVGNQADIVYGQPRTAVHRSSFRNFGSRTVKNILFWLTGNKRAKSFNSFRVVRGSLAREAASLATYGTYLDVALCWFTTRIHTLALTLEDPRDAAESGYSLSGLVRHALRMMMSSQIRGIGFIAAGGLASALLAAVGLAGAVAIKFFAPELADTQGWASLMSAILFFGGGSVFLGAVGLAYLVAIHQHSLGKPTYFAVDRSNDVALDDALQQHGFTYALSTTESS